MNPYSRQCISSEDIDAVVEVLKSDYLTQGDTVPRFEQAIASYCASSYAVAACNATAALHTACLALGVNSSSLVWIAATSFVASANCARYCDAKVDFIDTDANTGLISFPALEKKLETAKKNKQLPDVLIVVHLGGQSCNMKSIAALCKPYSVRIIEDACHALGGSYEGKPIGSCEYSDCAIFSFHPVKPITCGEGGMLVCNDRELAERARLLCNHGIVRDHKSFKSNKPAASLQTGGYYEQQILGYNFRLSDIQAALGLSQLQHLDARREQRQAQASYYDELFENTTVTVVKQSVVKQSEFSNSAWHLYPVLFSSSMIRNQTFELLRARSYGVNVHYMSIPSHPYYKNLGFKETDFPGASAWADRELSLPLHAFVSVEAQKDVASTVLSAGV